MKCSVCNNEVRGDMKFCSKCGAPIVKRKFCAQCGEELTSDVKFCRSCGSPNPNYMPPSNQEVNTPQVKPAVASTSAVASEPSIMPQHSVPPPPAVPKSKEEPTVLEEMSEALKEDSVELQEKSRKGVAGLWIAVVCVLALGGFIAWYFLSGDKPENQTASTETVMEKVETPKRYETESSAARDGESAELSNSTDKEKDSPGMKSESGVAEVGGVLGLHEGQNSFNAFMIHTDGRRFPFDLTLTYDPNNSPAIANAVYYNPSGKTKVNLKVEELRENFIRLTGKTGGKDFILQFSGDNPYTGEAWWGDFRQGIEMTLK